MDPSTTLPENFPLSVVRFHFPPNIAEEWNAGGKGSCCMETQKNPIVCHLSISQSHVPLNTAASQTN